mgnify:CR=1 FL=1
MRIALLGTSPSSRHLAPFDDPSWIIWGTGPGNLNSAGKLKRCDAFFEIHPWDDIAKEESYAPYCMALREVPKVYTQKPEIMLPNSVAYPLDEMVEKYGPYFFTSSFSYMMAMAIRDLLASPDKEKIMGFWGVDMSATEEYAAQRPGCHYFITMAQQRGIKVTIPPESDLLRPQPMYGLSETSPMAIKLLARKREIDARLASVQATYENAVREQMFLKGALDDLNYIINTWVD